MNRKIRELLEGKGENYIFPFFWLHGEDEKTLREYMNIIDGMHIKAVCVESRPHPDFLGERWWHDLDIILEEAQRRSMKVWILDDSHFPTGYCDGQISQKPPRLRRYSIVSRKFQPKVGKKGISLKNFLREKKKRAKGEIPTDQLLAVTAFDKARPEAEPVDLMGYVFGNTLQWIPPGEGYEICAVKKSINYGCRTEYMNMMDPDSCKVLIDTVYEPHFAHYGDLFGITIAGFFSDEPELGNGKMYANITLGEQTDYPWSDRLIPNLRDSLGEDWYKYLPCIWNGWGNSKLSAKVKGAYMDAVTRAVQKAFSEQVGGWCRTHGIQYIGHIIEDNNQHSRTGSSLGHYFRALRGQSMAGIDDIGGQVYPQGEEKPDKWMKVMERDGEFYHYTLAKLGQSLATIDPEKHGNSMCEIFGNYGWQEGFRLETYLADHFMVRGINHFVPHAFSAKKFPDPDCPPHFYAHGHNPQYRHFYVLMDYMNRICHLITGGKHVAKTAVLYTAEADWTGKCMQLQKPGRILQDAQIDYDIIPTDVFGEEKYFHTHLTDGFCVNGQSYRVLIIPQAQFISEELVSGIRRLLENGIPVFFLEAYPEGIYDEGCWGEALNGAKEVIGKCGVCKLKQLPEVLEAVGAREIYLEPASSRLRVMHYKNENDMYFMVNEGTGIYHGKIHIPNRGSCYAYNAWMNRLERVKSYSDKGGTILDVSIFPGKSLMVLFDQPEGELMSPVSELKREKNIKIHILDKGWKRSVVKSIDYPAFSTAKEVELPDEVCRDKPNFSGMIRYENVYEHRMDTQRVYLTVTDAYEGLELFVNGEKVGGQIIPPYEFDISEVLRQGKNEIKIEISTTLERERRAALNQGIIEILQHAKEKQPTGLTGVVKIICFG